MVGQSRTALPDVFAIERIIGDPRRLDQILSHRVCARRLHCEHCCSQLLHVQKDSLRLRCRNCGFRIAVKRLTPMAFSKWPIGLWVQAIWLVCGSNTGLSHHDLARWLGISRQAAMVIYAKLRTLMATYNEEVLLGGAGKSVAIYDSRVSFVRGNSDSPKRPRSIAVASDGQRVAAWAIRRHGYAATGRSVDCWIASDSSVQCLEISRYNVIRRRGLTFVAQDWDSPEMARAFAASLRIAGQIHKTFHTVDTDKLDSYLGERMFFENMANPAAAFRYLVQQLATISSVTGR